MVRNSLKPGKKLTKLPLKNILHVIISNDFV